MHLPVGTQHDREPADRPVGRSRGVADTVWIHVWGTRSARAASRQRHGDRSADDQRDDKERLTRTLPIVKLSSGPTLAVINGALGSSVSLLRPFLGNVPDPAYFGDFCVWWGIWLIAVSTGHAR